MTEIAARLVRPIQRLGMPSLVGIALAVLLAAAGALVAARAVEYRDAVLPGTEVAGIDVGGLSRSEAARKLDAGLSERLAAPVTVAVGGERFAVDPAALFRIDARATAARAYDAARSSYADRVGAMAVPFAVRHDVEPVLTVRERGRAELTHRLQQVTDHPVNARVAMEGEEPAVVPARPGTEVDEPELLAQIRAAALGGLPGVEATLSPVDPALTTDEAERAATIARIAVAAPVTLRLRRETLGELDRAALADLVRFEPTAGDYGVRIDAGGLARELRAAVAPFEREPTDATFSVDGSRARVVRARPGLELDASQAAASVLAAATGPGVRRAKLALAKVQPELTTADAKALGITERVSTFTTDMGVSSSNRIWNVHLMADYIDGTIVKPGQVFSFNDTVGPRTVKRGFREGQMIVGSLLLPAIGGGVCQTATTLFNNAFELGLPIVERHNHSFYISHYPLGRDATVSWGGPDFAFKNDLEHALLIKTSYTDSTLTFTFYGKKQGRRVSSATGPRTNWRKPETTYAYDPNAPRGSVTTQAGSHEAGFDVTVQRKVVEHGKVIRRDSFTSAYIAVGDTVVYGPGTNPPRIDFTIPSI